MKKINLSYIKGNLTKDQMKTIMAGSSCSGATCPSGVCSGGCRCSSGRCG